MFPGIFAKLKIEAFGFKTNLKIYRKVLCAIPFEGLKIQFNKYDWSLDKVDKILRNERCKKKRNTLPQL